MLPSPADPGRYLLMKFRSSQPVQYFPLQQCSKISIREKFIAIRSFAPERSIFGVYAVICSELKRKCQPVSGDVTAEIYVLK